MKIRALEHRGVSAAIGLLFAVLAGFLLLGYLSRAGGAGTQVEVPLARRDIARGSTVRNSDIEVRKVARRYTVPGTLKPSAVPGSRAARAVARGEPFTESSLEGSGGKGTLASMIPPEYRAYTLRPGASPGAGTRLGPSDRVDVLSTCGDPPCTSTILRERLVLEVSAGGGDGEGAEQVSVTLLVSPGEAELLAQAESVGEVSLSLCPPAGGER